MSSYIFKTFVILSVITLNSCTDQGDYEGRYIIENATEREVSIKFYERQQEEEPILVFIKTINGSGVLYDEVKDLDGVTDREVPIDIFGADSIAVIFDNQKIQAHYSSIPFQNSLSDFGDYISNGDTKRYIITEENYDDAVECNGDCE